MPERPDLDYVVPILDKELSGLTITSVRVKKPVVLRVAVPGTPGQLLTGCTFTAGVEAAGDPQPPPGSLAAIHVANLADLITEGDLAASDGGLGGQTEQRVVEMMADLVQQRAQEGLESHHLPALGRNHPDFGGRWFVRAGRRVQPV